MCIIASNNMMACSLHLLAVFSFAFCCFSPYLYVCMFFLATTSGLIKIYIFGKIANIPTFPYSALIIYVARSWQVASLSYGHWHVIPLSFYILAGLHTS